MSVYGVFLTRGHMDVWTDGQTGLYHDRLILKCSEDGTAQIVSGKESSECEPQPTQLLDRL